MANGNGNGFEAPVCHLPPTSDIPLPASPNLPAIPTPDGTIDGIMAALQALIQGYNLMSGQQPLMNANGQPSPKGSRFVETGRQKKKIHVTNPQDDSQYVDVEVVSALTLVDKVTGETWDWKL